jgi:hypothetical protein
MKTRCPWAELNALEVLCHDCEQGQNSSGSGTGSPMSGVCQ